MIAFDNGPANGDYARYIDDLMRARATDAAAGSVQPDIDLDAPRAVRPRPDAMTASQRSSRGPAQPSTAQSARPRTTGFVTPTEAAAKASAAAAIATALMSGEMGVRGARTNRVRSAVVVAVVGAVLLFVGLVVPLAFSGALAVAGVVLIAAAFRMIKNVASRSSAVGSTRA